MSLNYYIYCGNDPVNYIDPSGYVEEKLRNLVNDNNGNIEYDDKTRTATITVNGITKKYNLDDSNVKIKDDYIVVDTGDFARDYNLNQTMVEGKRSLAALGNGIKGIPSGFIGSGQAFVDTFNSLPEIGNGITEAFTDTGEYLTSKEAVIAYLQTGGTVIIVCAAPVSGIASASGVTVSGVSSKYYGLCCNYS